MSRLPNVEIAIAKKEDQLQRAQLLSVEHLQILATNAGRFAEDEFNIFFHELQLRQALVENPDIDVAYAREKMEKYADELISVIMTKDLVQYHTASYHLPETQDRLKALRSERAKHMQVKTEHLNAIKRLTNRI